MPAVNRDDEKASVSGFMRVCVFEACISIRKMKEMCDGDTSRRYRKDAGMMNDRSMVHSFSFRRLSFIVI